MADLDIPQRQTFPNVRGYATDARGALPLDDADEIVVLLQDGTDLFALPATAVDPEANSAIIGGAESPINWVAPIGAGITDAVASFRGKLKITWGVGQIQFVPQTGFMTVTVSENVQEEA